MHLCVLPIFINFAKYKNNDIVYAAQFDFIGLFIDDRLCIMHYELCIKKNYVKDWKCNDP